MQGTQDWHKARAGKVTASRFADVIGRGRDTKPLKARGDYLIEIITERLTGEPVPRSIGSWGAYGQEVENYARSAYEVKSGDSVREVGFIEHPTIEHVGCSPDGLIGDSGGLEIKCPSSRVHLETIITNTMPYKHMAQVQGCMWVTGRQWWQFVSYDPRMPEHLQLFTQRVPRDPEFIQLIETEVVNFLAEVSVFMEKLPRANP